jgi:hypothetical protein
MQSTSNCTSLFDYSLRRQFPRFLLEICCLVRGAILLLLVAALALVPQSAAAADYELATFEADITPPIGHPLLAGWKPAGG